MTEKMRSLAARQSTMFGFGLPTACARTRTCARADNENAGEREDSKRE